MTGEEIVKYIHEKQLCLLDDDGPAPHLVHYKDPENLHIHVMYVEDVEELIKKILIDHTEDLKYLNEIIEANNKLAQKFLRKEVDFASTGHNEDHQSGDE